MNIESRTKEESIAFEEEKNEITEEQQQTLSPLPTKKEADEITVDESRGSSAWKSEIATTEQNYNDDDESQHSQEEQSTRRVQLNRSNTKSQKCLCCSRRSKKYPNNEVKTSKYNFFSFLPLNLMVQFSKMANIYFLILGLMELIKPISDANGYPIMLVPLSFIIFVSMIKDIFEDYQRHKSDNDENSRKVLVAVKRIDRKTKQATYTFEERRWRNIEVGQIIKLKENQYFPCDVLVLNSSLPKGICYVETKNLDGETNLKNKQAPKQCITKAQDDPQVMNNFNESIIECETPNEFLYKYQGNLKFTEDQEDLLGLDIDNVCMRGSSLRNTDWIYGVAIFTGHQTKVMMNSTQSKPKFSKIEKSTNRFIIFGICVQSVLCLIAAIFGTFWNQFWYQEGVVFQEYLLTTHKYDVSGSPPYKLNSNYHADWYFSILILFGTWFLAMMNFVSSSLLVSQEMVKFLQGMLIEYDVTMFDETKDMSAKTQSSNLNEELGQISYIFSDKTGTLTQNVMDFKKFSAGMEAYGVTDTSVYGPIEYEKGVTNVNFADPTFWECWKDEKSANHQNLVDFINILAICHTIIIQRKDDVIDYNASSPDELALTNAARFFGIVFEDRDADNHIIIHNKMTNEREKYELLNVIEFTSARKRMTVIVKDPQGKIICMTKGADSHVLPRMAPGQEKLIAQTNTYIDEYAQEGLRTLILGQREVDPDFFSQWSKEYSQAAASLADREKKLDQVAEKIEKGFLLTGCTAIEDKLQDEVAETISFIRDADVKLWVLTGDKIETAMNIGFSCKLLDDDMEIFILDAVNTKQLYKQIKDFSKKQESIGLARDMAVVIGGEQLTKITSSKKDKILYEFLNLAKNSSVVLACRVSPKQKAEIVMMVRNNPDETEQNLTTLAIGDGANDVNMINSAHVGVGISGLEGQQAARAADYSIGQFKYLKTLMFIHGREAYRRNSYVVLYMFYKNVLYVLPIFYYGWYSQFGGTPFYGQVFYQGYNIVLTASPVIWFGCFDLEYAKESFMSNPQLYKIGLKNYCFNRYQFTRWYFYASWQSFVIVLLSFKTFQDSIDVVDKDLVYSSLELDGTFLVETIVILVNIKILISTNTHTVYSFLLNFQTIFWFYILFWFSAHSPSLPPPDINGMFWMLLGFKTQYWLLLLFIVGFILIDTGLSEIDKIIFKKIEEFEIEEQNTLLGIKEQKRRLKQEKLTVYKHKGFGFDGEAGNDSLLMENIKNRFQYAIATYFKEGITPTDGLFSVDVARNQLNKISKDEPHSASKARSETQSKVDQDHQGLKARNLSSFIPFTGSKKKLSDSDTSATKPKAMEEEEEEAKPLILKEQLSAPNQILTHPSDEFDQQLINGRAVNPSLFGPSISSQASIPQTTQTQEDPGYVGRMSLNQNDQNESYDPQAQDYQQ